MGSVPFQNAGQWERSLGVQVVGQPLGSKGRDLPISSLPMPKLLRPVSGRYLSWILAQFHALCPQDAYDISQLRHPTEVAALSTPLGRPPLRRDAPFGRARPPPPRVLPASPADIADFINDVGPPGVGGEGRNTYVHAHTHTRTPHVHASVYPCARAVMGSGLTAES